MTRYDKPVIEFTPRQNPRLPNPIQLFQTKEVYEVLPYGKRRLNSVWGKTEIRITYPEGSYYPLVIVTYAGQVYVGPTEIANRRQTRPLSILRRNSAALGLT